VRNYKTSGIVKIVLFYIYKKVSIVVLILEMILILALNSGKINKKATALGEHVAIVCSLGNFLLIFSIEAANGI
jgi:hypothetical protein